jgi:ABC-2 type transport system ATP-binding protein
MDEAERFDRIAMINKGGVLVADSPANIKSSMDKQILEIQCDELRKVYKILSDSGNESQLFGDRIDTAVDDPEADMKRIFSFLDSIGIKVSNYRLKPVSLENVFIHLLQGSNEFH